MYDHFIKKVWRRTACHRARHAVATQALLQITDLEIREWCRVNSLTKVDFPYFRVPGKPLVYACATRLVVRCFDGNDHADDEILRLALNTCRRHGITHVFSISVGRGPRWPGATGLITLTASVRGASVK